MEQVEFAASCTGADGVLRVLVSGELDLLSEPQLVELVRGELAAAVGSGQAPERVVLDLRAVSFIDSSGLRSLLSCKELAGEHGLPMALEVGGGPVTRLLDLAGMTPFFSFG